MKDLLRRIPPWVTLTSITTGTGLELKRNSTERWNLILATSPCGWPMVIFCTCWADVTKPFEKDALLCNSIRYQQRPTRHSDGFCIALGDTRKLFLCCSARFSSSPAALEPTIAWQVSTQHWAAMMRHWPSTKRLRTLHHPPPRIVM